MRLELVRFGYLNDCTLGTLWAGDLELATIERAWILNPIGPGGMSCESCVPDGSYKLVPHDSARFPDTYALINPDLGVYYQELPAGQRWGRTAILIHSANLAAELLGCIAVGLQHGELYGKPAVLSSRAATDKLRAMLGREIHELVIRPTAGTSERENRSVEVSA